MYVLSQEVVHKIKKDKKLFCIIADVLDVPHITLNGMLDRNSKYLNTYHTVVELSEYLNLKPNQILIKL